MTDTELVHYVHQNSSRTLATDSCTALVKYEFRLYVSRRVSRMAAWGSASLGTSLGTRRGVKAFTADFHICFSH